MDDIREEIVLKFLKADLQVHYDVVMWLAEKNDPSLADEVIKNVPPNAPVALPSHIPGWKQKGFEPAIPRLREPSKTQGSAPDETPDHHEADGTRFTSPAEIEVLYGKPFEHKSGVDFTDFIYYFKDRYEKLSKMLRGRGDPMPISALTQTVRYRQQTITIIGMISEVRNTAKGHRIAVLEDPTDTINVLFYNPQAASNNNYTNKDPEREKKKQEVFSEAERIIPDEVVMVKGTLSNEGTIIFADELHRPDIPLQNSPYKSKKPGKAVLISDVHVGSNTFLSEQWERFSEWISQSDVNYLLIAGDVVDGIGIYPDQDKELTIPNIYAQYEVFAQMLSKLPKHITIVVSPGNHDAIRGSEPQPGLTENFTEHFPENAYIVENPAMVDLQGVRVLMYHGRSYDDLISMIPGASYTEPEKMMVEMLKRRHLACTYGMRTPILAAKEDKLIIEPIPEILHTGHVHICGVEKYRGVLCINAGTWQSQTSFQKQMNVQPTPAQAYMVDLETLEYKLLDFNEETVRTIE
ncbi:DNA-directed DNA polymerase II small subunit [Methanoplanus sp. FWC-SCC4]|uniref:DNA polymerase II small subunit n=1 Tax=Methanochimaera problematica TaxID=2609417 RepID=A0AA97FEL9_9EURY|nr:DNA-directed DNA polymerase II small subunit [Methanoplanus sp. FWC-SCC4]WOF17132.1 DNA-directed DNA polymerase II small subunit [Methanoplanus sp. FWC-SCC4]